MKKVTLRRRALATVVRELRLLATCLEDYCDRQEKGQFKEPVFQAAVGEVLGSVWTHLLPLVEDAHRELSAISDGNGGGR